MHSKMYFPPKINCHLNNPILIHNTFLPRSFHLFTLQSSYACLKANPNNLVYSVKRQQHAKKTLVSTVRSTEGTSGETQEELGRETPHRDQNLQAPNFPTLSRVVQQRRIKWPAVSQHSVWVHFDHDASEIISATAKGDADRHLKTMTTIIVSYSAERFGLEDSKASRPTYGMNRRAEKICQLRQELRALTKQFKVATEEEKHPLTELWTIIRKKLLTLRRTEWHRRR